MFSKTSIYFLTAVLMLALAANTFASGPKPDAKKVGEGLLCQCGCNIQVSSHCQHGECASHAEMRALVQKEIDDGKDEAAIRADFVNRYGIQVLATPPAAGFYLTVWILPVLGVAVGLAIVIAFVRRWRRPRAETVDEAAAPIDAKAIAAMEEEMKQVTG
jgi:cytochrome c-type biogenesis protein CcmH